MVALVDHHHSLLLDLDRYYDEQHNNNHPNPLVPSDLLLPAPVELPFPVGVVMIVDHNPTFGSVIR